MEYAGSVFQKQHVSAKILSDLAGNSSRRIGTDLPFHGFRARHSVSHADTCCTFSSIAFD